MTKRVPSDQIERIVGAARHDWKHYARAVSAEQTVYVLHSRACLDSGIDLRDCEFSRALDRGINPARWVQDRALIVEVIKGWLMPASFSSPSYESATAGGSLGPDPLDHAHYRSHDSGEEAVQ